MTPWHALQLGFCACVLVLVAGRVRSLCFLAPVSEELLRDVLAAAERRDAARIGLLATQLPRALALSTAHAYFEQGQLGLDEAKSEALEAAHAWLPAIRISATLASTFGLLAAIVAIRAGLGGGEGLLALEAGLAQREAFGSALISMALGVATSGFCFAALARLRVAARRVARQVDAVQVALGGSAGCL